MELPPLIILDTNIFWNAAPSSSGADLLRALTAAEIRFAVPWTVLEELASQRALKYVEAHRKATEATAQLEQLVPWGGVPSLGQADAERLREHWREVYRGMVEVIEPSAETLRTALFRESNVLPPCKQLGKGAKTGARDAAIWLTAVEYARDHEDETVYFVSENIKDFGDGTDYVEPMKTDVAELGDRFVHLTSLDDVVKRFVRETEPDEGFLLAILAREEWTDAVSGALSDRLPAFDPTNVPGWLDSELPYTPLGEGMGARGEVHSALGWFEPPSLVFDGVSDMTAYSIGGRVWSMATVRWIVFGLMQLAEHRLTPAANIMETRLLVSEDERGAVQASILRSRAPRVLTAEEVDRVPDTWTNWRQELTERFPSNSFASRQPRFTPLSDLPPLTTNGEAIAALVGLIIDSFAQRRKSKQAAPPAPRRSTGGPADQ
jgi:hypothetical protein